MSINTQTSIFKLFLSLLITLILTACSHTEKYLHPERTFSLDAHDNSEIDPALSNLPIYETCTDKVSVHSPIIWFPLIGPAVDVSMSSKNIGTTKSRIDNAIIFLPLLGPALSFSATSPETCTYKTFKKDDKLALRHVNTPLSVDTVTYITAVSDQNCSTFLNRLASSKEGLNFTKTALTDIGSAVAAGTAFATPMGAAIIGVASLLTNKGAENLAHTYFGGQLVPAIVNDIIAERTAYKKEHLSNKVMSLARAIQAFNDYDRLCSVQTAIEHLNDASAKRNTSK